MSQQPSENPQTPSVEPKSPLTQFFDLASTGLPQWWRWVLGIIAILVIWQGLGGIPYGVAVTVCADLNTSGFICADGEAGLSQLSNFVLLNLSFVGALIGVWIVAKLLHKKSLTQVTTGRTSFDYSRVLHAAFVVGLPVYILVTLIYRLILGVEVTFEAPSLWVYLPFVLFALVLTTIQAGTEEVLFRGYLLQGLSLLTRNRLILALVTAVLFAAPHLANPEPAAYGFAIYFLAILTSGIFFAALTLLDGGIELAVGCHAINNLFLGLIANSDVSALATPSLFVVHQSQDEFLAVYFVDLFSMVLLVVLLNLKYKWFAYPWSKAANGS